MAAFGNSAIQMLTAPVMQYAKVEKDRNSPLVLVCGCACACACVIALSLSVIFWYMVGWYAGTEALHLEGTGNVDG